MHKHMYNTDFFATRKDPVEKNPTASRAFFSIFLILKELPLLWIIFSHHK